MLRIEDAALRRGDARLFRARSWRTASAITPELHRKRRQSVAAAQMVPRPLAGDVDGLQRHAPPQLASESSPPRCGEVDAEG